MFGGLESVGFGAWRVRVWECLQVWKHSGFRVRMYPKCRFAAGLSTDEGELNPSTPQPLNPSTPEPLNP